MNILIDALPETVLVCRKKYEIRTDFRFSMLFEILMQDNAIEPKEKTKRAIELYYPVPPQNYAEAVNALLWFYKCGKEENPVKQKMAARKAKTRVYSFDYDDDYIYAAFMTQYGIDLNDIEYMHWWKFRAMFNSLTNQNEFVKIMEYRSMDIKGDMPKEQKEFYKKMQKLHALPTARDEDEKLNDIEQALINGGNLSGLL